MTGPWTDVDNIRVFDGPGYAVAAGHPVAAREGLRVALISHEEHLGGMLSNGLGVFDTLYMGSRAPLYDELRDPGRDRSGRRVRLQRNSG